MRRLVGILLLASVMAWAAPAPAGNPPVPEKFISVDQAKALLDKRERITFVYGNCRAPRSPGDQGREVRHLELDQHRSQERHWHVDRR